MAAKCEMLSKVYSLEQQCQCDVGVCADDCVDRAGAFDPDVLQHIYIDSAQGN